MKQEVVIVVPMYRVEMDAFERISWEQLQRVLGAYPICFVAPASVADGLRIRYGIPVEAFPDAYFRSVQSYSRMMLDADFYRRFGQYAYMLVYQLDAFVFSNQLQQYCAMGYDYIGAPWPALFTRWIPLCVPRVGNGGFSLRKISAMCRILSRKDEIFHGLSAVQEKHCMDSEDIFWAYCSTVPALQFSVPAAALAHRFSVEYLSHEKTSRDRLPFGCHGWSKVGYREWRRVIRAFGYDVPARKDSGANTQSIRRNNLQRYVLERILKSSRRHRILAHVFQQIPPSKKLAIWGWGNYGKLLYELLTAGGREVVAVYDQGKCGAVTASGIEIQAADAAHLQKDDTYLLISTLRYEDEISRELQAMGWRERMDYACVSEVQAQLYEAYVSSFGEQGKGRPAWRR